MYACMDLSRSREGYHDQGKDGAPKIANASNSMSNQLDLDSIPLHTTSISSANMSENQQKPEGDQGTSLKVEEPAPKPSETPHNAQATTTPVNDNEIKVFSAPVASTSSSTSTDNNSSLPSQETSKESMSRRPSRPGSRADDSADPDLPDAFFEPSIQDAQSYHATVISRSKRLNEAPLLTSKHRDEDRLLREKKKAEKWPTVHIPSKLS